jgi:hypothetical protein
MAYVIGILYKTHLFARNLIKINRLMKESSKVKEGKYWIVHLNSEIPAFSFFNFIFIKSTYKDLSVNDLQVIMKHEMVHVDQYHTLDSLFVELFGIVFWFNPMVNYLKMSLKEIHEYAVDERLAGHGEGKKAYAQLLLTLASESKAFDLATNFTGEHIKRRILMIARSSTPAINKLMFFVLVPLAAILSLSFSCIKSPQANTRIQSEKKDIKPELRKYCGLYFPSKRGVNFGLKPMEVILKDNKLFADGTVAMNFESDSIFSFNDNSARSIRFFLDRKKEVTGCALLKLETRGNAYYLVLKGEYLKGNR